MLTFNFGPVNRLQQGGRLLQNKQVSINVSKVVLNGRPWTVQVTLQMPPGGPQFESFQSWWVNNEIYLIDAAGKRFTNNGGYVSDANSNERAVLCLLFHR